MTYPTAADFGPPTMGTPFAGGFQSGRGPMSPGLEATSERWNEMAQQAGTAPHSVLNQLAPSPIVANVSAPSQRERLLPNGYMLDNYANGAASPTAQNEGNLRMAQQ